MKPVLVWDLPTRIFHWLLAAFVAGLVVSAQLGGNLMAWHGRLGILVVGLIAFRLVWGLAGSTYARFAQFLPSPSRLVAYLKGEWRGVGHNPLGALSVLTLLAVVTLQVSTGLFANDDIAFNGPLYSLVGKDASDRLTAYHKLAATVLYVLVGLHVAAITFYTRIRKDPLVRTMITGCKLSRHGESARGGGLLALAVALVVAGLAMWAASGSWLPPPPVAAPPAW